MSENRPWQIDRETAERLLRGESAVPSDGHDALAGLLAAAAAPAQAGELAGESAAMTAFWEASRSDTPRSQERPEFRTRVARFLTVKAAAVAVALMAFGGAALAAGTGALPVTQSSPAERRPPPAQHASKPTVPVTPPASKHAVGPTPSASAATSTPALARLCRSYLAPSKKAGSHEAADKPDHVVKEPAPGALLSAAGSVKKIRAYCRGVERALRHGDGQHRHRQTVPGFPTKTPTWPTGHPSEPTQRLGDHDGN